MHSKGNVRYSVQSTNIEQRGKPRYLGMHVIEKWRTRQVWEDIVVSRHKRRAGPDITVCPVTAFFNLPVALCALSC